MRFRSCSVLLALVACNGGGSSDDEDPDTSGSADTTETGDTGMIPETGPLACPGGESCTIVIASQALDDRVEIFTARGSGPAYRGAIDLDLKPNPGGNNEGENLDEPFGMTVSEAGLSLLLGHYPARNSGSLVVFPHEFLAGQEQGTTIPQSSFFAGGTFTAPVTDILLGEEEPIFAVQHPSGRILVGAFENDLFAPETEWTNPGQLVVVDPATGEVGRKVLDPLGTGGCQGAWSIVALDDAVDTVALSCDGNDGAVVLDVSGIGQGSVADATAAVDGCFADVLFPDKRVRSIAPDGEGGFLLVEHSTLADLQDGRFYRFDGECNPIGAMTTFSGALFEIRQSVLFSTDAGPRWLLASGLLPEHGVHVVRDSGAGPEVCGRLADLDASWTGDDGGEIHPYALALDRGHTGLAIGAGPPEALDDMAGYGRVLWAELDPSVDPCEASPVVSVTDLTASAPAVDAGDPATWRRGPNVVHIVQYGP